MRTKDVSEMTDEELEAVDMESNLDGSEYSDGDTMEPMDGDYSSADFETGVSDESMDAAIDGDYTDFSEDFSDEDFINPLQFKYHPAASVSSEPYCPGSSMLSSVKSS